MLNIKALALTVLIVIIEVKVSDRFTEWQKDGMKELQTAVYIDSCSLLKKNKLILQTFSRNNDENNTYY